MPAPQSYLDPSGMGYRAEVDDEEEEQYRRQLADHSKRGYYGNHGSQPTKYRDTEL